MSLGDVAVFIALLLMMLFQTLLMPIFPCINGSWTVLDWALMRFKQFIPNVINVGKASYSLLVCVAVVVETSTMGFMNGEHV